MSEIIVIPFEQTLVETVVITILYGVVFGFIGGYIASGQLPEGGRVLYFPVGVLVTVFFTVIGASVGIFMYMMSVSYLFVTGNSVPLIFTWFFVPLAVLMIFIFFNYRCRGNNVCR